MNRLVILGFLLICAASLGCADEHDAIYDEMNGLWRQGYGFNNPNVDRQRKGLSPQNFDGSYDRK